jgi:excisionase family DNA binding protein
MISAPHLLSPDEVGELLNVNRRRVMDMYRNKQLPGIKINPKTVRFDPEAVDKILAARSAFQPRKGRVIWNIDQLCDLLGLHRWQIIKLVRRNFIPATDTGQGIYLFDVTEVMSRIVSCKLQFSYRPGFSKSTADTKEQKQ